MNKDANIKKKVCLCIPTADRAEMVEEVLRYEMDYYPDFDMDIVCFDSSNDDRTEELVREYREKGFGNLIYKRTPKDLCIDYKIIYIWSQEKWLLDYDYVWLINDSISITKDSLVEIFSYLNDEYSLMRLPVEGSGNKEDFLTEDPNEWFHSCSKGMAHMGSTIMNTQLLRGNIDWDCLSYKYVKNNDIYSNDHGFFFTVGFYLERILELERFKGILIGNRRKWRRDSPLKKGKSYWNDFVFETWARSYVDTILSCPESYTNKEDVIKKSDNILFGRFESRSLIGFRIQGLFSLEVYERYKRYWPLVSTLDLKEIKEIAATPVEELIVLYGGDYGKTDRWEESLDKIVKHLPQEKLILVYGAGLYGEYTVRKLLEDGIERNRLRIVVSKPNDNVDEVHGIKVQSIDEYAAQKDDAHIIIATLPDTADKIESNLIEKEYKHRYRLF